MYYILNQNGKIVAADTALLSSLAVDNVDELHQKISREEISVILEKDQLLLTENDQTRTFSATEHALTGMLGALTLVAVNANTETISHMIEQNDEPTGFNHDKTELPHKETEATIAEESPTLHESAHFELKDKDTELYTEESEKTSDDKTQLSHEIDDEIYDLVIPSSTDNAIAKIDDHLSHTQEEETTPIYIDIDTVSQKIGISTEDYTLFLNEYIDTALALKASLQSDNKEEQTDALNKLSHLSNVLHLPYINDILKQFNSATENERHEHISSFFATLERLTTTRFKENKHPSEETDKAQPYTAEEKESIDLSDVSPIHFDFQMEAAANDLNLPVELISEFVNDFIIQAREETDAMLAAYQKGDLETIQKIGHMLKGTSSNLRIVPLADTLYEIQFNEDIHKVPDLMKNYWGHFLSFENQIKLISQ